jgi:hypothetical protein
MSPKHSFAAYTDALREHISPERWAKKLAEKCEQEVNGRLAGIKE